MANVKPVRLCKHCGTSDLPDPLPNYCMQCGSPLTSLGGGLFSPPTYLSSQRDSVMEALSSERLSPGDKIFDEKMAEAQRELVRCARQAPYKWHLDCLLDSKRFLENVLFSRLSRREVAEVVKLGQAIGAVANAISEYLKCGGKHSDRDIVPFSAVKGDGGWNQESNHEGRSRPGPYTE